MNELSDQILHFLWTFIALLPVLIRQNIKTSALSALLICLPRELVDQWHGHIGAGKLLDIFSFTLGGVVVGMVFTRQYFFRTRFLKRLEKIEA